MLQYKRKKTTSIQIKFAEKATFRKFEFESSSGHRISWVFYVTPGRHWDRTFNHVMATFIHIPSNSVFAIIQLCNATDLYSMLLTMSLNKLQEDRSRSCFVAYGWGILRFQAPSVPRESVSFRITQKLFLLWSHIRGPRVSGLHDLTIRHITDPLVLTFSREPIWVSCH
jgi:hypothetical protein